MKGSTDDAPCCTICLEPLDVQIKQQYHNHVDRDSLGTVPLLTCGHNSNFHDTCLRIWVKTQQRDVHLLQGKVSCPLCRVESIHVMQMESEIMGDMYSDHGMYNEIVDEDHVLTHPSDKYYAALVNVWVLLSLPVSFTIMLHLLFTNSILLWLAFGCALLIVSRGLILKNPIDFFTYYLLCVVILYWDSLTRSHLATKQESPTFLKVSAFCFMCMILVNICMVVIARQRSR